MSAPNYWVRARARASDATWLPRKMGLSAMNDTVRLVTVSLISFSDKSPKADWCWEVRIAEVISSVDKCIGDFGTNPDAALAKEARFRGVRLGMAVQIQAC